MTLDLAWGAPPPYEPREPYTDEVRRFLDALIGRPGEWARWPFVVDKFTAVDLRHCARVHQNHELNTQMRHGAANTVVLYARFE